MAEALSCYGPHASATAQCGDVAFARCLFRMLPEDAFDRQPMEAAGARLLIAADLRLDNRAELLAALGHGESVEIADSRLLCEAWVRWGEGTLDRLCGDYALAVWDREDERLTLARDTSGERPLHWCEGPGYFAFASMPTALLDLPGMARRENGLRMAQFVADLPVSGSLSYFDRVFRVEPGHVVRLGRGGAEARRYWAPSTRELRLGSVEQYGEALREQLDRAVRARLRRADGGVGSHLSSGFDSSAVTTSAATLLRASGERLTAFTSAPREGFDSPVPAGRRADESPLASATAALHPTIDHVVVRPPGPAPLSLFDADHREAAQPVGHICNNMWFTMIGEEARRRSIRVLLTGDAGNFTISAGSGLDQLPDFLRTGRLGAWAREAAALARGPYRWRNVLHASIAPWMPRRLYLALRGLQPGFATGAEDLTFVALRWRDEMIRLSKESGWDVLPPRDSKARRWKLLQTYDAGNFRKRSLARWGLEERDPTSDRRLVEFCFSLPPEAFLRNGVRRPAMRHALAPRLPAEVLDQSLRGYQMPDWYEHFPAEEMREAVAELEAEGENGVVDLAALRTAAQSWPAGGWHERPIIYFYRIKFLRALAACHFIRSARSAAEG
jgi:asparagine synthase (glutamine-hydrolysing)